MLEKFELQGETVDALDLKCMLVSAGMRYPVQVYEAVAGKARLEPPSNPFACNCVILPGDVAVHLNINDTSLFALDVDCDGAVCLFHEGQRVAPVSFPPPCDYNAQTTAAGRPFSSIAVLEGDAVLAFFYMWSCEYAKTEEQCTFCFQVMAEMVGYSMPSPSPEEVAEIVAWGLEHAGVKEIQLTAGSRFAAKSECADYAEILRAIDRRVGLSRIPSEIYCYMTAQRDPTAVDQVFEAGAHRVAHDLHVWDAVLHAKHAPGHARKVGRAAQLRALEYIAGKHGPNKAVSAFVAGLEPVESMVAGAEYLAQRGIVPAFSVWMPTPGSEGTPPGIAYYRKARREFARLYREHGLVPPGIPAGSHVSLCKDIYRHADEILAEGPHRAGVSKVTRSKRMKLILVGGFLGAGKTSLLYQAAQALAKRGLVVGLITNDQAPDLVDTALLSESGAGVREVAGSCFCCNFEGFREAVASLAAGGAEVVLAEPVGSCTDLSATILQPLKERYPEYETAPLSVLIDPQRVRGVLQGTESLLHPDAAYILRLQLEEADRIVLSKVDTLDAGEELALVAYLRSEFPLAPVDLLSTRMGRGLDEWLDIVLAGGAAGQRVVPVDYDRYAHGEAVLGWLNMSLDLRWIGGLTADWEFFVGGVMGEVQSRLEELAAEVGHVKMLLVSGEDRITANLTGLDAEAQIVASGMLERLGASLTLNARAQMGAEALKDLVQGALEAASYGRVAVGVRRVHCLQPGRPVPTFRYGAVVG